MFIRSARSTHLGAAVNTSPPKMVVAPAVPVAMVISWLPPMEETFTIGVELIARQSSAACSLGASQIRTRYDSRELSRSADTSQGFRGGEGC